MNRSPFVAMLPGNVPMAFPVAFTFEDVKAATKVAAESERAVIAIVRDEGNGRDVLGTVAPDGTWTEAR